jgi:hypothetical protein
MDPSTIKFLIGHHQDSTVMETTYQHLTDEDHINEARRRTESGRDPDEKEGSLTPETCPTCREPLGPNAKACSACGSVFTPDSKAAKDTIEDTVRDAKDDADELQEHKDLDKLERLVSENPELVEVLEGMVDE